MSNKDIYYYLLYEYLSSLVFFLNDVSAQWKNTPMDPDKRSPCPPHLLLLPSVVQWTTIQWYKGLEQKNYDYLSRNHDIDSTDFRRIFTGFAALSVTLPKAGGRVWGLFMPLSETKTECSQVSIRTLKPNFLPSFPSARMSSCPFRHIVTPPNSLHNWVTWLEESIEGSGSRPN